MEKPGKPQKQRKPTAVTGLQIVEYLSKHSRGTKLGDIAAAVQMDTGQTHRILAALAEDGWVAQGPEKGNYALTARVLRLGATYAAKTDLVEQAMPFMEELAETTSETIHLGELRRDNIVCIALKLSDRRLTVYTKVGDVWPLVGTSMGHAVRAASFARTGLDPAGKVVPEEVLNVLRDGYGRDYGRYRNEVESVAAPIRDLEGVEIGALAVAGPSSRISEEDIARYGGLVSKAAAAISERLGCADPWPPPRDQPSETDA